MKWVKKLWFPVSVVVLVGIIGVSLYTIISNRGSGGDASNSVAARNGNANGNPEQSKKKAIPDLVSSPGPREVVLRLRPTNGQTAIKADTLLAALKVIGPVDDAVLDGNTARLMISNSLRLSELEERLGFQETAIVDEESPLDGGFRLHVSGMT